MNPKLSVLVVDDLPNPRQYLRRILEAHAAIGVCQEAESGEQALIMLDQSSYDLVFLDVHMGELDGITVAQTIAQRSNPPLVIFVTAYDQNAGAIYDVNAVDFVRKGASAARVYAAVSKALERLKSTKRQDPPADKLLWGKSQDGDTPLINIADIIWVEAKDGKVFVHTSQRTKIEVGKTLENLTAILPASQFMHVHKSFIVNLDRIKKRVDYSTTSARLLMDDGSTIDVGPKFLSALKQRFAS